MSVAAKTLLKKFGARVAQARLEANFETVVGTNDGGCFVAKIGDLATEVKVSTRAVVLYISAAYSTVDDEIRLISLYREILA
jgi:hypothetical protein